MIFPCGVIEFSIVYAYLSPHNSCHGYKLILLIGDHCHPSFFWYHLYWTHPCTIGDWVDDACIKEFDNFVPDHFLHIGVKSPLRYYYWPMVNFHLDFVGIKQGTNSLIV